MNGRHFEMGSPILPKLSLPWGTANVHLLREELQAPFRRPYSVRFKTDVKSLFFPKHMRTFLKHFILHYFQVSLSVSQSSINKRKIKTKK